MPTQVQFRRGTTAQNNNFTGAVGEISIDTSTKQLRIHDGITPGGAILGASSTTATNISAGTAGQVPYQTGAGATSFFGPGSYGQVLLSGGTNGPSYSSTLTLTNGVVSVLGTTDSTNTTTGALVVSGGVGIGGNLQVGGNITAQGNIIANGNITLGNQTTDTLTIGAEVNSDILPYTNATYNLGSSSLAWKRIWTGDLTASGAVTATTFVGALSQSLTAGTGLTGSAYNGSAAQTWTLNTATLMQVATQVVQSHSTGTGILGSAFNGSTAQTWSLDTSTLMTKATQVVQSLTAGTGLTGTAFNGSTAQTWTLNTATLMQTAVNLGSGAAGSLPYQTAANATGFLAIGTSGFVLTSNGSAPTWSALSGLSAGLATTATNLAGGVGGSVPYQSAAGSTTFLGIGSANSIMVSNGSVPSWTTSPTIGGNVIITGNLTVQGATTTVDSTVTNVADPIITIGGGAAGAAPASNDGKDRGIAFQWHNGTVAKIGFFGYKNSSGKMTFIPDATITSEVVTGTKGSLDAYLAGGGAGQIVYQSAADTTGFVGTATTGNFLQANYTGAPTWTGTASIYVNRATVADSVANALTISTGLTGSVSTYNGSAAVTVSLNTATLMQVATQVVQSHSTGTGILGSAFNGSTAQTWSLDTSTLMARATQVVQSLTAGTGLTGTAFNGSTAQTWTVNTATLMQTSLNLAGGVAGQIPYQTGAGSTSFITTATTGNFLQAGYNGVPTWTTTASIYVNRATVADNAVQVNTVAQTASASYYPTFVSANNASATAMSVYTTSSFNINPATGVVTLTSALVQDPAATSVGTTAATIDTFAAATYRSAKYIISVSNSGLGQYQTTEILLVHNGTTPYQQETSVFSGATALMTFSATISTGNVLLQGTGANAGNSVKVQKVYITV